jgi:CRISPR-associated protein (TIGR03986 family)
MADGVKPTAPYRFVPLVDAVPPSPVPEPRHDKPLAGQLSGTIEVAWEATTPLLIGDPQEVVDGLPGLVLPTVLVPDEKAGKTFDERRGVLRAACIPGASLRGMIRSVYEIITYSRLTQLNADYRFGFRNFDDDDYKRQVLAEGAVKAGWLEVDGDGTWWLRPCQWRKVEIAVIHAQARATHAATWITWNLERKYALLSTHVAGRNPPFVWQDDWRWDDSSGTLTRSAGGGAASGAGVPATIVVSGPATSASANKRFEYVFFAAVGDEERGRIDPMIRLDFERVHGRLNARGEFEPDGSWAVLKPNLRVDVPTELRRIPIFFVGDPNDPLMPGNRLRLGLTRLFKLGHTFAVGDLLPASHRSRSPRDMTEALFGMVPRTDDDPDIKALRSRVAFGFATLDEEGQSSLAPTTELRAVLMTPRASFEPYYLAGSRLSYSSESGGRPMATLAGRKRYPVRFAADVGGMRAHADKAPSERVVSRLRFLMPIKGGALRFVSAIRFHNLARAELGALLWSLTFGGSADHRHALGRAKPFGFGTLKVDPDRLRVRYAAGSADPPADWQSLLKDFEDLIAKNFPANNMRDLPPVKALLEQASPVRGTMRFRRGELAYLESPEAHTLLRKERIRRERVRNPPMRELE